MILKNKYKELKMKLLKKELLNQKYECWDITTSKNHNFIAEGAVVHNSNARFVWAKNPDTGEYEQYCGSRTNWLKDETNDIWWKIFHATPSIGLWCKAHPDVILYGEVFGQVQKGYNYGVAGGLAFAAFAMLDKGIWISYDEMIKSLNEFDVPVVPFVYRGPFNRQLFYKMAEENSRWPTAKEQISEGLVIVPVKERINPKLGRVCLKIVSNRYLES